MREDRFDPAPGEPNEAPGDSRAMRGVGAYDTGAGGTILPDAGESLETDLPEAAQGSLATSGPDDQARGDTETGLGFRDVQGRPDDAGSGVAAGPQSGRVPLGSRYPGVEEAVLPPGHEGDLPGELGEDAGLSSDVR